MNVDVLTTRVADGIAIITLGSARRIYFDAEMGDAITEALDKFAGDNKVRVDRQTQEASCFLREHNRNTRHDWARLSAGCIPLPSNARPTGPGRSKAPRGKAGSRLS
jgi:hypothetical protein